MNSIHIKEKNNSIKNIVSKILPVFGERFFETYKVENDLYLIDFWEDDLCAIGLKKDNKVAHISTWDYQSNDMSDMKYYVDFELIDATSLETLFTEKEFNEIKEKDLIKELQLFFDNTL